MCVLCRAGVRCCPRYNTRCPRDLLWLCLFCGWVDGRPPRVEIESVSLCLWRWCVWGSRASAFVTCQGKASVSDDGFHDERCMMVLFAAVCLFPSHPRTTTTPQHPHTSKKSPNVKTHVLLFNFGCCCCCCCCVVVQPPPFLRAGDFCLLVLFQYAHQWPNAAHFDHAFFPNPPHTGHAQP